MQRTRQAFDEELGQLEQRLLAMGAFVEAMLEKAIRALAAQDGNLAREVADDTADSDIDVAIVLDDFDSVGAEINRWSEIRTDLSLRYERVIALIPIRAAEWRERRRPLLLNLRREGVAV